MLALLWKDFLLELRTKERIASLFVLSLLIVLILLFGGGGGYYGHTRWGPSGGAGVGLGTVLLVVLLVYLLGGLRY